MMTAKGSQNNEAMVNPSHQKLKQMLVKNKEHRMMTAKGSQNNEAMVNPSHQKLKQTLVKNKKRKRGEEVTVIGGFKIAHFSKKKQAMINDKADELWCDLQNKEASSSSTSAEICMEVLGHIPGHIRGRSASTRHVFETESLRMDLNSEKEKSKQLEKDHLELKENHLKLQKEHVSLTKKVNFMLKHFTAWQSAGNVMGNDTDDDGNDTDDNEKGIEETEDFDEPEDYGDYVDA